MNSPQRTFNAASVDSDRRWNEICLLAPQLRMLEMRVKAMPRRERNWRGWSEVKRCLSRYVGWDARDERLSGSCEYDVVYARLLAAWEGGS